MSRLRGCFLLLEGGVGVGVGEGGGGGGGGGGGCLTFIASRVTELCFDVATDWVDDGSAVTHFRQHGNTRRRSGGPVEN